MPNSTRYPVHLLYMNSHGDLVFGTITDPTANPIVHPLPLADFETRGYDDAAAVLGRMNLSFLGGMYKQKLAHAPTLQAGFAATRAAVHAEMDAQDPLSPPTRTTAANERHVISTTHPANVCYPLRLLYMDDENNVVFSIIPTPTSAQVAHSLPLAKLDARGYDSTATLLGQMNLSFLGSSYQQHLTHAPALQAGIAARRAALFAEMGVPDPKLPPPPPPEKGIP